MSAVDALTSEDRALIGQIRSIIEQRGHYQGEGSSVDCAKACLVRQTGLMQRGMVIQTRIFAAIAEAAGVEEAYRDHYVYERPSDVAITWNDAVDTDEVLDVLAALEVG